MENEIEIDRDYNLRRLQKWLDFEISSSSMILLSWFWGILLFIAVIAAFVFTPLMLKILFEEKKYGWITSFFLMVLIPAAAIQFIDISSSYRFILSYLPLAAFFFFCFMLKLAVRRWIADRRFQRGEPVLIKNGTDVFNNYRL